MLSGSQGEGFAEKNEIFPYETSSNCKFCSEEFINCIKQFNKTYEIKELNKIKHCKHCYNIWLDACKIKDSRSIYKRMFDTLNSNY